MLDLCPTRQRCLGPLRSACDYFTNIGITDRAAPRGFKSDSLPFHSGRSQRGEDGASPAASDATADAGDMPLAVDVAEDEFSFSFTADVPGVQRSAVKVQ